MNEANGSPGNSDETVILPVAAVSDLRDHADFPDHLWAFDDFTRAEPGPEAEVAVGLTSVPYITAALRRLAWVWIATAVIGLLGGAAAYVAFSPAYGASTSLLLTNNPTEDPLQAMTTDITLAQSRSVAELAVSKLGPSEQVDTLMKDTTVASKTTRVMVITASAPSSSEAVNRARALAAAFLEFRANQLQSQQQSVLAGLNQQISQAQQRVTQLGKQVSQVSAEPASPERNARLASLQDQHTQAETNLSTLQQTVTDNQANTRVTTASMLHGSAVLDPAVPVAHSRFKLAAIYLFAGLVAGLAIGIGIVIVRALVSDRLRRRDDIAQALGADVKVSVGSIGTSRLRPGGRAGGREVQRIVAYLRTAVSRHTRRPDSLAIAAVDNADVVAKSLVALARISAQEGKKVVVADLSDRFATARLLGTRSPGIHRVSAEGHELVLVVPDRDNATPVGPFGESLSRGLPAPDPSLIAACDSADLVLTLVTVDPALSADHLPTWADDVVVVVTAGRSSSTRIQATGEMLRVAGLHLKPAVLIGADKTDESLGTVTAPDPLAAGHRDLGFLGK